MGWVSWRVWPFFYQLRVSPPLCWGSNGWTKGLHTWPALVIWSGLLSGQTQQSSWGALKAKWTMTVETRGAWLKGIAYPIQTRMVFIYWTSVRVPTCPWHNFPATGSPSVHLAPGLLRVKINDRFCNHAIRPLALWGGHLVFPCGELDWCGRRRRIPRRLNRVRSAGQTDLPEPVPHLFNSHICQSFNFNLRAMGITGS